MAVTRKKAIELAQEVRLELNRPTEDDLLGFPDAYFRALGKAHRYIRRKVAEHEPQVLMPDSPTLVTSSDNGETFDLGDFYIGSVGVWEPPGPPDGLPILPALPEQSRHGYWIDGTVLHLTRAKDYSPGLYITGITVTSDFPSDEADEHDLPPYCEDALVLRAAYELATTPGMAVDAMSYKRRFENEWKGDRDDPSDMGILGLLKRRSNFGGVETAVDEFDRPWWRNLPA